MSTDPCLDAALAYVRKLQHRPWYCRLWSWYKNFTGYEAYQVERRLKIQSTALPEVSPANTPTFPLNVPPGGMKQAAGDSRE